MAILNHMSDIPYSKKTTEVDPYIEAFDINNDNIDFDVLNNYKESDYVHNADKLDELSDSINIIQNNWNNDVIRDLSNKYNLYQSWIDNLKSTAKPWNNASWISDPELTPYLFRKSPDLNHIYNAEVGTIVGGTVVWNQLVQNGNFANTSSWSVSNCSLSALNNEATITVANNQMAYISQSGGIIANHRYLFILDIKTNSASSALVQVGNSGRVFSAGSSYTKGAYWLNPDESADIIVGLISPLAGDVLNLKNVMLIDLTQMFGSTTIADYIYSLEQTTEGAGVAWLKSHGFMTKDYYEYDAGSLKSVQTSGHIMRDADDNIIGNYPLDPNLELRGMLKLDSSNNLYYDGDEYESDGTVTRKYGIVDLGTLTWVYNSNWGGYGAFYCNPALTGIKGYTDSASPNAICAGYPCVSRNALYGSSANGLCIPSNGQISIRNSAYTDAQTFKTAMSGVYLVYELAIPTTETADPYQRIQIVDKNGTEEFVDNRTVAVPVGQNTKYLEIISIEYHKNDIVTYVNDDGAIFLCIQDCDGLEPLPDASNPVNSYWARFDSKGEPGENSCDLQWRGEWNIENTYSVKDVVWYSPNSTSTLFYVCIKTASGQQILDVNYWISFYSIWMDDRIDSYDNMPNQDWFDDDYNPTIFYIRHNDEISNRPIIQFVNRIESESASNPAYVDMGSDISSLLVYFNNSSRDYQLLTDVWDSFIKSNNLYSNVRR